MELSLRPAVALARAGLVVIAVALAACAQHAPLPADATGRLFAHSLDEITDLYLEPVSSRTLALAGADRLTRLDHRLAVIETPGAGDSSVVALDYGGNEVATYPVPGGGEPHEWGELISEMIGAARSVSPRVAALSEDQIERVVFDGITGALDRFSRYAPPDMARDQRAARDGFGGVGISLDLAKGAFQITEVTPRSPADRAGIQPGDKIVAIDGVPTAGRAQGDVVEKLRGPIFSAVDVRVSRAGLAQPRDFRMKRALIVVPTVTMSRHGNIVILHVASFNQSTTERIVESLAEAQRQIGAPPSGVVLDLRGNPGGLLDQAVSLADLFINQGPIVSTVGRHPASKQFFAAAGDSIAPRIPVAVLINGGSASSSEIVAAALQDVGRAVVIGSSSYGKGTVQTVLRLPNDGELILTWARLVTPSGYLLQAHGVVPTLCTSDLGNDERSLQIALGRARAISPTSPLTPRARRSLDEADWAALRESCPGRLGDRDIDLKVAERVLEDPALYSEALHAIASNAGIASQPGAGLASPEPGLTAAEGTLSSGSRNP